MTTCRNYRVPLLKIEREYSGAIHVQSTGGPLFAKPVAGQLITCRNTELWFHIDKQKQERRSIGLKPDERNLLSTLPRQICEDVEGNDTNDFVNEGTEDLDFYQTSMHPHNWTNC